MRAFSFLVLTLVLTLSLSGQEIYDLLLKNGHVIDPANHRNGRFDVAVTGGRIARVGADLPASHARIVVDAGQYYVTPGLVDIDTDFNWIGSELGLKPEAETFQSGVTTAVSRWRIELEKLRRIQKARDRPFAHAAVGVLEYRGRQRRGRGGRHGAKISAGNRRTSTRGDAIDGGVEGCRAEPHDRDVGIGLEPAAALAISRRMFTAGLF